MSQLERDVTALRLLFQPWLTKPHGTAIWEPTSSDLNAPFKHEVIAKVTRVLVAGDSALLGVGYGVIPSFDTDSKLIEEVLADDPEQNAFLLLARACENVVQSLKATAA